MPRPIPESTRRSVHLRLLDRQEARWPQLARVHVRFRAQFAYVDAEYPDGTRQPLCRLRCQGSASQWGFAVWRASTEGYDEAVFPIGLPVGTPEEALDTACGLYVGDPTAWQPPADTTGE
jgi:hypothetical protein